MIAYLGCRGAAPAEGHSRATHDGPIVNVKSKVTLLRSGAPPHPPSYLGHPLPQGGEGSVNLNCCPRPLGGEDGEQSEPGEGVSNLFKFVYISKGKKARESPDPGRWPGLC